MVIPRRSAALVVLSTVLLGCSPQVDWFEGDPGDPPRRVQEAEVQLKRLETGLFHVENFEPTGEARLTFLDFYEHPTRVFAVNFRAKARCTQAFEVVNRDRLMHRQGEPGFSMSDFERDAQLLALFGEGELIPGQKLSIEAAAIFDVLEPGFRFRAFDRPRQSAP